MSCIVKGCTETDCRRICDTHFKAMPLKLRRRFWNETNYNARDPTPKLVEMIQADAEARTNRLAYDAVVRLGETSLGENQFWCVMHPDGPLEETASKSIAEPVQMICAALKTDWDDLKEQGFSIGTITKAPV